MKAYPAGTKLVITWVPPQHLIDAPSPRLGDVYVSDGWLGYPDYNGTSIDFADNLLCQGFEEMHPTLPGTLCWPIDWVRPLEDPDPKDTEIEKEKELVQ